MKWRETLYARDWLPASAACKSSPLAGATTNLLAAISVALIRAGIVGMIQAL